METPSGDAKSIQKLHVTFPSYRTNLIRVQNFLYFQNFIILNKHLGILVTTKSLKGQCSVNSGVNRRGSV